jgi:hypothetical protein
VLTLVASAAQRVWPAFGFPGGTACCDDAIAARMLGFSDTNKILIWPGLDAYNPTLSGKIWLIRASTGPNTKVSESAINIPAQCHPVDLALSHDGRRLAWISRDRKDVSKLWTIIGKWFPSRRPKTTEYSLHTCRLDGSVQPQMTQ